MRKQLLLTLAISTFLTVTAAAIVEAAPIVDIGKGSVSVNLAGGSTTVPTCVDLNNDGKPDGVNCPAPGGGGGTGGGGTGGGGGGTGGGGGGGHHGGNNGGGGGGGNTTHEEKRPRHHHQAPGAIRKPDGTPTNSNPTLTVADFGPPTAGVPNFIINQFEIPPFLLPIYQACGTQFDMPWEVLAAINKIETGFGRLNEVTSSAGAIGWMQFLPSTWEAYGVDANNDGKRDPYNPVDAICAAARYLRAAGGDKDLRRGIFAYNHADWYVDEVLLYAKSYGKLPDDLVGSLTGLTEGAQFPVAAKSRYADDVSERGKSSGPKSTNIFSKQGAPVVAVNDGVIKDIGHDAKRGNFFVLEDAYGNRYTYSGLESLASSYPAPKDKPLSPKDFELVKPKTDSKPSGPATAGLQRRAGLHQTQEGLLRTRQRALAKRGAVNAEDIRDRLFALPQRPHNRDQAGLTGQLDSLMGKHMPGYSTFKGYLADVFQFDPKDSTMEPLRKGSRVVGGTVLGKIGKVDGTAPHVNFAIRPAGKKSPNINPKPVLDGWKLLEATELYKVQGKNPLVDGASVGQVLLMGKEALERRVLADPAVEIYSCGRQDIQTGQIDRRVLAGIEYLVARGYRLTITSLKCGHSYLTASGNVSEHSSGNAMDIAIVNGIPILGHQGKGSITENVLHDMLKLQGPMRPHQLISLMNLGGPSFALSDHADHIHVGFRPAGGSNVGDEFKQLLKPDQWERLINRIAKIPQPEVPTKPSKYALSAKGKRGSRGD